MGIFDRIKNAIWGHSDPKPEATPTTDAATKPIVASASGMRMAPNAAKADISVPPGTAVDIAAILDAAVRKKGRKLNWRTSIVDLMKALDLDSSFAARKELARELGYEGSTKSSAKMNVWLHKQVIQKLKDNGGKVPDDLH